MSVVGHREAVYTGCRLWLFSGARLRICAAQILHVFQPSIFSVYALLSVNCYCILIPCGWRAARGRGDGCALRQQSAERAGGSLATQGGWETLGKPGGDTNYSCPLDAVVAARTGENGSGGDQRDHYGGDGATLGRRLLLGGRLYGGHAGRRPQGPDHRDALLPHPLRRPRDRDADAGCVCRGAPRLLRVQAHGVPRLWGSRHPRSRSYAGYLLAMSHSTSGGRTWSNATFITEQADDCGHQPTAVYDDVRKQNVL